MLGTKTKQIYSYGKRSQRIVNVSDDKHRRVHIFDDIEPVPRAPIAAKMKRRDHMVHSKSRTPSPKVVHLNRKKKFSPTVSPLKTLARLAEILEAETIKALPISNTGSVSSSKSAGTPLRAPLAPFSLNTPGSPAFAEKSKAVSVRGKSSKLKPFSPFVDVDILVLDDSGKTVRQERRVSRTDVQPNTANQAKRNPTEKLSIIQLSADVVDDDTSIELKRPKRTARRPIITVDSDSESDVEDIELSDDNECRSSNTPISLGSIPIPTASSSSYTATMPGPSRLKVEVIIPPASYAIKKLIVNKPAVAQKPIQPPPHYQPPSPLLGRARQLTPIRRGRGRNPFNVLPPSPSPSLTSVDLDLSFDIDELSSAGLGSTPLPAPEFPDSLKPLLAECGQSVCGPIEFSSFIETFPYDPVVQSFDGLSTNLQFRKIGEASYSEVFGIGDVVLKVIPLREESDTNPGVESSENTDQDDGPAPSDARDVLKEIIVTDAMGQVCDGFVKLLKAYVVRGKYPEVLLRLWDAYHASKGSESVRPDNFLVSQVYAIIVLPNGGPDLDAYKFVNSSKVGWRQACSIFWQVAKSLAHAEQLVSFEHRDLHLGQILVKDLPVLDPRPLQARNQNLRSKSKASHVYMDDPAHGVRATLIDLGLSRMDAGDGNGGEMVHWTPFEVEVFMGEGDYQFDVYRMMKLHNGGAWEEFKPFTNVMWLHYLVTKLMKSKRLKAPVVSRTSQATETAVFTEKSCYDCLVDIEGWLRTCVAALVPPLKTKSKGKKKAPAASLEPIVPLSGPACAGEVVAYAIKKGWVQAIV
ncbi:hypothetical protein H0H87_001690 [Tephrocybe sp. NHM501043]|nr:hypothetical protein H0H87_001690 [Tephrocybe sp. NHM501043]